MTYEKEICSRVSIQNYTEGEQAADLASDTSARDLHILGFTRSHSECNALGRWPSPRLRDVTSCYWRKDDHKNDI